jgi:hypothetical protein
MANERSIEAILALLDTQIAHDREKEAFHAQQEAFHRSAPSSRPSSSG